MNERMNEYSGIMSKRAPANQQEDKHILKMGEGLKPFSKERQMANEYGKRFQTSIIIRVMQIRTTERKYLTPTKMAMIKTTENSTHWRGCGETGTLMHCW